MIEGMTNEQVRLLGKSIGEGFAEATGLKVGFDGSGALLSTLSGIDDLLELLRSERGSAQARAVEPNPTRNPQTLAIFQAMLYAVTEYDCPPEDTLVDAAIDYACHLTEAEIDAVAAMTVGDALGWPRPKPAAQGVDS